MATRRGSQYREQLEESDYRVHERRSDTEVILVDTDTGLHELWVMNDDFAGYVIEIDGKGYEFVSSVSADDEQFRERTFNAACDGVHDALVDYVASRNSRKDDPLEVVGLKDLLDS